MIIFLYIIFFNVIYYYYNCNNNNYFIFIFIFLIFFDYFYYDYFSPDVSACVCSAFSLIYQSKTDNGSNAAASD